MVTQSSLSTALAIMAGAGILLGGLGGADAAAVTQTQTFTVSSTDGNNSALVAFDAFNASLGTLTQVEFALSAPSVTGSEQLSYTGAEGATASFGETVAVIEPSGTTLTSASGSAVTGCFSYNGVSCSGSASFSLSSSLSTSPTILTGASLAPFLSTPLDFSVALQDYTPDLQYCGNCQLTDTVNFSGKLTLTYEYTPAVPTIPEPTSLALLTAGAIGIAGTRRRRIRLAKDMQSYD
jgi:hypothetical protein